MDPAAEPYRQECLRLIDGLTVELDCDLSDINRMVQGSLADVYQAAEQKARESLIQLRKEISRG